MVPAQRKPAVPSGSDTDSTQTPDTSESSPGEFSSAEDEPIEGEGSGTPQDKETGLREVAGSLQHLMTPLPKNLYGKRCQGAKMISKHSKSGPHPDIPTKVVSGTADWMISRN